MTDLSPQFVTMLIAFSSLCVAIWKIRRDDLEGWRKCVQAIKDDLAAFKLTVATNHPTNNDLAENDKRWSAAVEGFNTRIDGLTSRLDKFIDRISVK